MTRHRPCSLGHSTDVVASVSRVRPPPSCVTWRLASTSHLGEKLNSSPGIAAFLWLLPATVVHTRHGRRIAVDSSPPQRAVRLPLLARPLLPLPRPPAPRGRENSPSSPACRSFALPSAARGPLQVLSYGPLSSCRSYFRFTNEKAGTQMMCSQGRVDGRDSGSRACTAA